MSETGVVVRPATVADLEGVVACSSALFAEDAGLRDPTVNVAWPAERGMAQFRDALGDPYRLVMVAEDAGLIIGHLTGTLSGPTPMRPVKVATLGSVYVQPAHRGQKIGAGLVEEFRAWARHHGAQYAGVTSYASNEAAVRFYERNGFAMRSVVLETVL
ncbi:GNAT family N-acetyltransferase [Streptosporangium sp. NBC_01639]|uniref:GNAT family N-acetyltransferase n=1 Tax=unclassified Streptosporangium TaxID=2632669 RepID=UPI002DD9B0E7|nr:GNAT family N-acetyltransferase [Streptosporangium sp. NBC_01756]WSC89227.1 GNAT family N-acetyltransferase [Streptosporangium sp. NBC_01756]WTD52103.1 GNAT family N-acetyltransferase [Streptosporangium sp. NBC_01639]